MFTLMHVTDPPPYCPLCHWTPPTRAQSEPNCMFVFFYVLSKCDKIENPLKCEVWSAICLLNVKKFQPNEIYRQIMEIYSDCIMNEASVGKCSILWSNIILEYPYHWSSKNEGEDRCFTIDSYIVSWNFKSSTSSGFLKFSWIM